MDTGIVKSVYSDQNELLVNLLGLYTPDGLVDLDPTYSLGKFYGDGVPFPTMKFDINPQREDVKKGDCRNLPLGDSCINSIMFDPPFLSTTGKSLEDDNLSNKINKRFSVYPSETSLHQMYIDSLREFYRILTPNGILIFKCMDKVSSGKQYFSHCFVYNEAVKIGFYAKDLFILTAKNRLVADWQKENQKHARKYHSYFWVFQKADKKVEFIK